VLAEGAARSDEDPIAVRRWRELRHVSIAEGIHRRERARRRFAAAVFGQYQDVGILAR